MSKPPVFEREQLERLDKASLIKVILALHAQLAEQRVYYYL